MGVLSQNIVDIKVFLSSRQEIESIEFLTHHFISRRKLKNATWYINEDYKWGC